MYKLPLKQVTIEAEVVRGGNEKGETMVSFFVKHNFQAN